MVKDAVKDIDIARAFVATASVFTKIRHGKFIPATYWAPKVSQKLPVKVSAKKLGRALEKPHITNRIFTENDDQIGLGSITKIESTERRISRNDAKTPTRVLFICVVTGACAQEILPENQSELSKHFQDRYDHYHRRRSMLHLPPPTPLKAANLVKESIPSPVQESNKLFDDGNDGSARVIVKQKLWRGE